MGRRMRLPGRTSRTSRLPPHSPWPSRLVQDLAIRGDAERADERRDRPRYTIAEVKRPVAHLSMRVGFVTENCAWCSRPTVPASASIRPAVRASGRSRSRSTRLPGFLQSSRRACRRAPPFEMDGAADGVGLRWAAVEAGRRYGDGLVGRRLEIARAGVPRLDLEGSRPAGRARSGSSSPVEGIFEGQVARDALHGENSGTLQGRDAPLRWLFPAPEPSAMNAILRVHCPTARASSPPCPTSSSATAATSSTSTSTPTPKAAFLHAAGMVAGQLHARRRRRPTRSGGVRPQLRPGMVADLRRPARPRRRLLQQGAALPLRSAAAPAAGRIGGRHRAGCVQPRRRPPRRRLFRPAVRRVAGDEGQQGESGGTTAGIAGGAWHRSGGAGAVHADPVAGVRGALARPGHQHPPLLSAGVRRSAAVSPGARRAASS